MPPMLCDPTFPRILQAHTEDHTKKSGPASISRANSLDQMGLQLEASRPRIEWNSVRIPAPLWDEL